MSKISPNVRTTRETTLNPMTVCDNIILECRNRIETKLKARIRATLLPLVKWECKAHSIGEGFQWGRPFSARGAKIGRYVYVGRGCDLSGRVVIGDLTMVSTNCVILGHDHLFEDVGVPIRYNFPTEARPVTIIESEVWIGHGVILMEGIHIGRGSIIAAGSIVTTNVTAYSIVGGIPAKNIRDRYGKDEIAEHDRLLYQEEFS